MSIRVQGIRKRFGEFVALDGVDLEIETGQLVALLGPSGCGKTTLLRVLAGLESPDAGRVDLHGRDATQLPVQARNVGFVFQHYALFRHMSVFDNVAFGLTVRPRRTRPARTQIRARVEELLSLVQLDWAADRLPAQLSGGQRQRVALARALAIEPAVLLLDEPFGALDTQVRQELRRWLRRLHDALHFTSVFVTHDQQEALEVADSVVVMNRGRIEQRGAPADVYDRPASPFVHRFVGTSHVLPAERTADRVRIGPIDAGLVPGPDGPLEARVRPHDLALARDGEGWPARVGAVRVLGPLVQVELTLDGVPGGPRIAELSREQYEAPPWRTGDAVRLSLKRWALYDRAEAA
ncbi:MAG: sulfate/molybdate ABC transporter ATP-binding protein [Pseudomonadota bacterium]